MFGKRFRPVLKRARIGTALLLAILGGAALSCVGSEPDREARADKVGTDRRPEPARAMPRPDTLTPVTYQVIGSSVVSDSPRKVILRILVPSQATRPAANRTLRLTLDSLRQAEPDLVAARAVAYVGEMSARSEAKLYYAAWGEWVPPEGWDSATAESRDRTHRIITYAGYPEWEVEKPTDDASIE